METPREGVGNGTQQAQTAKNGGTAQQNRIPQGFDGVNFEQERGTYKGQEIGTATDRSRTDKDPAA